MLGADLAPPRINVHDLCPIPQDGRSGEIGDHPSIGTRPCPDALPVPCWPPRCWPLLPHCLRPPTASPATPLPFGDRPHAMATSQPLAADCTGRDEGEARRWTAIAANAALGLMEPTGNGIGGDLFAIVWDPKTQKLYGYNGSGRSPKSLTLAEFQRRGLKDIPATGLPVSVPGGRRLVRAATASAASRWPTTWRRPSATRARAIRRRGDRLLLGPLGAQAVAVPFKEQFTINGHARARGEMWKNPNLASTLQQIADGGRDAFYKGAIAHTIGDYFKANGGYLSYQDMADHHGESGSNRSAATTVATTCELPPNSQGIAALQILNVLEGYDFSKIPFGSRARAPVRRSEEAGLRRPCASMPTWPSSRRRCRS